MYVYIYIYWSPAKKKADILFHGSIYRLTSQELQTHYAT